MNLPRYQKGLLFSMLLLFGVFVHGGVAKADYGSLPQMLTQQPYQYVNITDNSNAPQGLYATSSWHKVYTNNNNGGAGTRFLNFNLTNGSADDDCKDYQIYADFFTGPYEYFSNWAAAPASTVPLLPMSDLDSKNYPSANVCNKNYSIPINNNLFSGPSTSDYAGIYGVVMRLRIATVNPDNSGGGSTGHTAYLNISGASTAPDTRLGYVGGAYSTTYPYSFDTNVFRGLNNQPYTLSWRFRTPCTVDNANWPIMWGDDDVPSVNQSSILRVELRKYASQTSSSYTATQLAQRSGPGGSVSVYPPEGVWDRNSRYELVFSNVFGGNGIWALLPSDSAAFDVPCPREFDTSGTTGITSADEENPTSFTATGNIQRNGGETDAPIISTRLAVTRNGTEVGSSSTGGSPWAWAGNVTVPSYTFNAPSGVRALGWNAGDRICSVLTWRYAKGSVIPGTLDIRRLDVDTRTVTSSTCVTITDKPYVSAFGNDVSAGGGFSPSCTGTGDIRAYTKNGGSGTQLAAYANGSISGFKSVFLKDIGSPITPNGLTFGNTPGLGNYSQVDCATNFFDVDQYEDGDARKKDFNGASLNIGAPGLIQNGEQTTISVPPGAKLRINGVNNFSVRHSIFVDGDVYIDSDITYGTTSWPNIAAIPYFNLVVRGNIYISQDVTRLDGRYIAQPRDATNGGYIYTCAYRSGGPAPPASQMQPVPTNPGSELWNNCRNRLTVTGQFVAKSIRFLRVLDTISNGQAGETPQNAARQPRAAEIFNFSPEMYLAQPATRAKSSATSGEYQTITTLPPIL